MSLTSWAGKNCCSIPPWNHRHPAPGCRGRFRYHSRPGRKGPRETTARRSRALPEETSCASAAFPFQELLDGAFIGEAPFRHDRLDELVVIGRGGVDPVGEGIDHETRHA